MERHDLYSSPNNIRVIKSGKIWAVTPVGGRGGRKEMRAFSFVGGRKKRDHFQEKLSGEFNIEMDLNNERWEGMDWIYLAQDKDRMLALVNMVRTFGFHKIRGIRDKLKNYYLVREKCDP